MGLAGQQLLIQVLQILHKHLGRTAESERHLSVPPSEVESAGQPSDCAAE